MPRKKAKLRTRKQDIPQWQLNFLADGNYEKAKKEGYGMKVFFFCHEHSEHLNILGDNMYSLYSKIRDRFLQDWIEKYPATRPHIWWLVDSPEERQHLGGGERCDHFTCKTYFGIHPYWYYDKTDLPFFESEANYLKRLGLLKKSELDHLKKNPGLLKPVDLETELPGVEPEIKYQSET